MSGAIGSGTANILLSLPSGYAATASSKAAATSGTAAQVADLVDIRVPLPAASFTARAGDSLSVRDLFGSPDAALMRVALRGEGGGRLLLRGEDVTARTDFEPLDYNELQFVAGEDGSAQDIVAVARKGSRNEAGAWTGMADSEPVQITALVTGRRSVETAAALRTGPEQEDGDADILSVARSAAIFTPLGSAKAPSLSGVGNITLKPGDTVSLRDLFTAATDPALFRVALRDDPAAPGARLLLEGEDVTHRIDFTPEQFNRLQLVAGPGGAPELLVVARAATKDAEGAWRSIVDSPAVALTAAVTGTRSANAAAALRTEIDPAAPDANFLRVAQDAAVFAPSASRSAPGLSTLGDITVKEGDRLSMRELFPVSGSVEPALYRVALRDDPDGPSGGRLLLNGEDVTARTDFSPTEFLSLQYAAGPGGGAQDLLVVARKGTPDGQGGLTLLVDSPPALVRAEVTGSRSLNTAGALRTALDPVAPDADFMSVAGQAVLYAPLAGQAAPGLFTAGNFTAAAGDRFALRDLFTSPYSATLPVAQYRVALRDEDAASGARLLLNGEDVTRRLGFTPEEFNALQFEAGATGSAQDILVVARSANADGTNIRDSRAVQLTARATGERSLNALPALREAAPGDAYARIAQDASVYAAFGSTTAPALSAVGDFTAEAGDLFSMNTLFDTAGGVFAEGVTFRVAMRADPSGIDPSATGGGALVLNGVDVTGRTEFTGAEFVSLLFRAGLSGSAQDLVVVARRTGTGGVITDSPAMEITARASGERSINAMAALRTATDPASGFDRIVQDAAIFRTSTAPRLASSLAPGLRPDLTAASARALASAIGAYRATGAADKAQIDFAARLGGTANTAALQSMAELVTLLGGGTVGGVRTAGTDIAKLATLALRV